ncbi:hypothetical protein NE237_011564 [Protea cynaroides]|uniref:RNase H type-1 domain-containing protein n=1 Tax=Protea cynaroides TaxID=273540 RepID=A0A9Q0JWW7_9MAGN|nr:hypothetical protein NE237_011564 [Protea cynaroides]
MDHVLLHCTFARAVLLGSQLTLVIPPRNDLKLYQWLLQLSSVPMTTKTHAQQVFSLVGFICWTIWKARNELYFEQNDSSPVDVILRAERAYKEYSGIAFLHNLHPHLTVGVHFQFPHGFLFLMVFLKLNTDAAFSDRFSDSDIAVRAGLSEAFKAGYSTLFVKSDCLDMIRMPNGDLLQEDVYLMLIVENSL